MIGVLRSATPWLMAGLIGVAVYSGMQAKQYAVELDQARDSIEALSSTLEWQRGQLTELHQALQARDDRLALEREHIDQSRAAAGELERNDEEVADWAGSTLPGPIDEWLRRLQAPAGAGDANGASNADPAATGTGPTD